jgi:endonuclease/exonuclease/phosphatase family metal-dependent hydrolase
VHGNLDAGNTVHGFLGPAYKPKKARPYSKIDFIFVKGEVTPVESHVIKDEIGDKYPSDHYFVSADVRL